MRNIEITVINPPQRITSVEIRRGYTDADADARIEAAGLLRASNNLSDLNNVFEAREALSIYSKDEVDYTLWLLDSDIRGFYNDVFSNLDTDIQNLRADFNAEVDSLNGEINSINASLISVYDQLDWLENRVHLNDLKVTGADRLKLDGSNSMTANLNLLFGGQNSIRLAVSALGTPSIQLANGQGGAHDVLLYRGGPNILELRNGANAQEFRIYNTFTDAANFERAYIRFGAGSELIIGTERSGTGGLRPVNLVAASGASLHLHNDIKLQPTAAGTLFFNLSSGVAAWKYAGNTGHWIPHADAVYDFGATANRVSNLHSNFVQVYQELWLRTTGGVQGRLYSSSNGKILFKNGSGTAAAQLILGIAESNVHPALKPNGAELQVRLADDSAFAVIQGIIKASNNAAAGAPAATHTITIQDATGTSYRVLCAV